MRLLCACSLLLSGFAFGASPLALPDIWLAEDDRSVTLAQWQGRAVILAMEYGNCRFVCSINLQKFKEIQTEVDRRSLDLDFVIVSIDPVNDTPASWRKSRASHNLDRHNWRFITGDRVYGQLCWASSGGTTTSI